MKQLTCEMCGSTDLMKDGGVFVCQTCGCKYSVEEARKMMVEGTVDVSGSTVKVDTSAKLQNLYTLARRAKDDENFHDAAKYYHEIRLEDPNSWEAAFYGVYFTALDCRIGQIESAARSITNTIDTVSNMIQTHVPKEEQKEAYTECLLRALLAGRMLFGASKSTYEDSDYSDARSDFIDRATACMLTAMAAGIAAEEIFKDYELAQTIYTSVVEMCNSSYVTKSYAKISQERIDGLKPKLREIQKKKNEEYWKEHAEEKQKHDARIAEINSEIKQLQAQVRQYDAQIAEIKKDLQQHIPAESQLAELKRQQNDLVNQKSKLGLFAGKQKKALQEQIDSMQPQINSTEETVKRQRKAIQDDVNARVSAVDRECKPIKDKISSLEREKSAINAELTKDR